MLVATNHTGVLKVSVSYKGPSDVRAAQLASGRAPWITRTVSLIRADDISHADASAMVERLQEENPGMVFEADWVGPFNLLQKEKK